MDRPAAPILPALAAALFVAIGLVEFWAASRPYAWSGAASAESSNLVVAGFRAGHVWLDKAAPPALAAAPNPYLFATYRPFLAPPWSLTDLSYYQGHLYAYFGVTPVVLLFWPYRILTGNYLHEAHAVLAFCLLGYAFSVGLALAVARRYFPGAGPGSLAAAALILGTATTLPVFMVRPGLYEVAIGCGYAFVMLALFSLWQAWHVPGRRLAWTAVASLSFGLAVGARPSLLFGAGVLFISPLALWLRRRRDPAAAPWLGTFLATLLPIAAIGAGLALYNQLRFGHPLQFGHQYQLTGYDVYGQPAFAPSFAWDNLRLYFLEPIRWQPVFPFAWAPAAPPLQANHQPVEFFFGVLVAAPVLWLALLSPLVGRIPDGGPTLRVAAGLLGLLFLADAIPICCYAGATSRYLLDFLPALALLSWLGWLALERLWPEGRIGAWALVGVSATLVWLLSLSLSSFYSGGEEGLRLLMAGQTERGIALYRDLSLLNPEFKPKAEFTVGAVLLQQGHAPEAAAYLAAAVRDRPTLEAARFDLGSAQLQLGQLAAAAASFQAAAGLDPDDAAAEAGEAVALARLGRRQEAIAHARAAVRIDPTQAEYRQLLRYLGAPVP